MQKLLSVIVPVYNVEKYLKTCIEHLLKQTYKNVELILVDDGSTDKSGDICDRYSKKHRNMRVIHKANGGLSDARNAGMDIANGEYIAFVDSDDYIHPSMYSIMMPLIDTFGVDYIESEFLKVYSDIETPKINEYTVEVSNKTEDTIGDCMAWNKHYPVAWNKIYRHALVRDLRFPKGKINEDEYFMSAFWPRVKRVGYVSAPLYYYRQHPNSIMGKRISMNRIDGYNAIIERYSMILDYFPTQLDRYLLHATDTYLWYMDEIYKQGYDDDSSIRKAFTDSVLTLYEQIMACSSISQDKKNFISSARENFPQFIESYELTFDRLVE